MTTSTLLAMLTQCYKQTLSGGWLSETKSKGCHRSIYLYSTDIYKISTIQTVLWPLQNSVSYIGHSTSALSCTPISDLQINQ